MACIQIQESAKQMSPQIWFVKLKSTIHSPRYISLDKILSWLVLQRPQLESNVVYVQDTLEPLLRSQPLRTIFLRFPVWKNNRELGVERLGWKLHCSSLRCLNTHGFPLLLPLSGLILKKALGEFMPICYLLCPEGEWMIEVTLSVDLLLMLW